MPQSPGSNGNDLKTVSKFTDQLSEKQLAIPGIIAGIAISFFLLVGAARHLYDGNLSGGSFVALLGAVFIAFTIKEILDYPKCLYGKNQ
jgi:ABC-type Fe3+ transport system permease subunit